MPQQCPGCVWYIIFLVVDSCLLRGSVVLWLHMSPHDVCAVRAMIWVVGSIHNSWATCLCIHSWISGRFSWLAIHHNYMQGLLLRIPSLPSWLLSRSYAPGFWGDVVRAAFQYIQCQNYPLSRQIGLVTIYGTRDQVLWLPDLLSRVCSNSLASLPDCGKP